MKIILMALISLAAAPTLTLASDHGVCVNDAGETIPAKDKADCEAKGGQWDTHQE